MYVANTSDYKIFAVTVATLHLDTLTVYSTVTNTTEYCFPAK